MDSYGCYRGSYTLSPHLGVFHYRLRIRVTAQSLVSAPGAMKARGPRLMQLSVQLPESQSVGDVVLQ